MNDVCDVAKEMILEVTTNEVSAIPWRHGAI
jgi:hypothetical protein